MCPNNPKENSLKQSTSKAAEGNNDEFKFSVLDTKETDIEQSPLLPKTPNLKQTKEQNI